jgi:zinc protease
MYRLIYQPVLLAAAVLADMTEIQLGKMMSGKTVSVSPYISETTQGISASSSPKGF